MVRIPEEDLDGSSSTDDYKSFAEPVHVEVTDLLSFYREMGFLSMDVNTASVNAMGEMPLMVHSGLSTPLEGEILPEGQSAARFLNNRISEFRMFVADVGRGLTNIGNAAVVVAEMYEGSDNENGATLNDIGFVFADSGATGPRGFRKTETYSEQQEKLRQQSGQNAQALTGDERFAKAASYPYGTIYTFGDGSSKTTYSGYERGPNGETVTISTVTVRGPDGKVLSQTTNRSYTDGQGRPVTTVTSATGEGAQRHASTSRTTENSDGSITVTNETQTGTNAPVPSGDPVTVQRDSHRGGDVETPVGDIADTLGTDGGDQATRDYGRA